LSTQFVAWINLSLIRNSTYNTFIIPSQSRLQFCNFFPIITHFWKKNKETMRNKSIFTVVIFIQGVRRPHSPPRKEGEIHKKQRMLGISSEFGDTQLRATRFSCPSGVLSSVWVPQAVHGPGCVSTMVINRRPPNSRQWGLIMHITD
jgi:hypothetical protein